MATNDLRFAVLGAGFWTPYQLAAWRELRGVRCVAIYNRTRARAESVARTLGIPSVYDDLDELLERESPAFVDNITEVGGHRPLTEQAARRGVPVICQKPLASSRDDAHAMVRSCRQAGVPLLVHENWRWQAPIRAVATLLRSGAVGAPFRARIDMISGFEGWLNQPALRDLEQFILTDLGSHILDTARFLFGEAASVYAITQRTLPNVLRGENVATVTMVMGDPPVTVLCQMAYARTPLERESFPQTLMFIEGDEGSIELDVNYWVRVTTRRGTLSVRHPPPRYAWADPRYDVVHASIVACNANLLAALRGEPVAETTGDDNLKTVDLVFDSYESARTGQVIHLPAGQRSH
jgi:predicted dehydrogenase